MNEEIIVKTRRQLIVRLLICLFIAAMCIVPVLFKGFSDKEKQAVQLSELITSKDEKEGQYVQFEFDALPVMITQGNKDDSQLYYIKDEETHAYIVDLSSETICEIIDMLDVNTGKLNSVYTLKGTTYAIDDVVERVALANSFKVFPGEEVNHDNFSQYLGEIYIKDDFVSDRQVTIYQIIVFLGVFFIVLALGYIVPHMIKVNKGDFGIQDEQKMRQSLERYLPQGETLIAGVYALGKTTEFRQVFGKCILDDDKLIPDEDGSTIGVNKCKYAQYYLYIGITQHHLLITDCEPCKHMYEFEDLGKLDVEGINSTISLQDIGTCFTLTQIESCTIKKGFFGEVKCTITLKNKSLIKIMIPRTGGYAMEHHAEYRQALLDCLNTYNSDKK